MTVAVRAARERVVRPREQLIARRLQRFAWRHRAAVSELTCRHPRLADLALSFPALLFALAVPRPRFDPEPVIERVIAGAPLSELAKDGRIPMWTRKLSPEAFLYPIPKLPDGEMFRKQIANHLPPSPKGANRWLKVVSEAGIWGGDNLAVWFARQRQDPERRESAKCLPLICLWAWHAAHPDAPASRYLEVKWTPEISVGQARSAALTWSASVLAALHLGEEPITDPWAFPGSFDGFAFAPVLSAADLIGHARALDNCSRNYAANIEANLSRIWVVTKDGQRIAMLALAAAHNNPYPSLGQLSGPSNAVVAPEVTLAAERWARTSVWFRPVNVKRMCGYPRERWVRMWRSYWLDRRKVPVWLPLAPGGGVWRNLIAVEVDDWLW